LGKSGSTAGTFDRRSNIQTLKDSSIVWDLFIIALGISGAGTLLDAASRGFKVAGCDRGDFMCGTSSKCSNLLHGGLRYLKQLLFKLVREALRERTIIMRNAPELTEELLFVIPVYNPLKLIWYLSGVFLYDYFAGDYRLTPAKFLTRAQTIKALPNVRTRWLLGGVQYSDAKFDDANFGLAVLETAADHGAVFAN